MMDLENRITGDWIDIREASTNQYILNAFLKIPSLRLAQLASNLRLAVEQGILEYKNTILRPVFVSLEETRYQNLSPEELQTHENPLECLIFIILLQKMICAGVIPLPKEKTSVPVSTEEIDVHQVISNIKSRINDNPEFQKHPAVKNIFLQIGIYRKEKTKMEELLPTIKEDKRETFRQNFENTFELIFDSIRKNYADILKEDEEQMLENETKNDLVHRIDLKTLIPILTEQAKNFSRIRSTLIFAAEDKYKTREIFVSLHNEKENFLNIIDRERGLYLKLCAEFYRVDDCVNEISNRFRDILIRVVEKLSYSED